MHEKMKRFVHAEVVLHLVLFFLVTVCMHAACAAGPDSRKGDIADIQTMIPPFDVPLKYPFAEFDAKKCGHWKSGSQDYPYFGAPRERNTRYHAGIDLYPVTGTGTPVKAIKDGRIIKIAPFYKRRNGETTYAMLIDHGVFTANYAELKKPLLVAGAIVKQKQTIGFISGTKQLHFELYKSGTTHWASWYGKMPQHLIDPTDLMTKVLDKGSY